MSGSKTRASLAVELRLTEPITVYLAGPISHLSYDEAMSRRAELIEPLRAAQVTYGIRFAIRSPMRGKMFLAHVRGPLKPGGYRQAMSTDSAIVGRDETDVRVCEVMIADFLGAPEKSIGTCVEFGLCLAWHKFVIMIIEEGKLNPHDHGFLRRIAHCIVRTREEAVKALLQYAGVEPDES
jgi:nucleoside 2-deoxyribosyltransferase